jgi:hypothetical protein
MRLRSGSQLNGRNSELTTQGDNGRGRSSEPHSNSRITDEVVETLATAREQRCDLVSGRSSGADVPGRCEALSLEFLCGTAQSRPVIAADVIGRERELAELCGCLDAGLSVPAALRVEGEPGDRRDGDQGAGLFAALGDLLEPVLSEMLPVLPVD